MGGLTPARLQEHAFVSLELALSCAICDKRREEKPHNGVRIDRLPENRVIFPDLVTANTVGPPAITFTHIIAPGFQ